MNKTKLTTGRKIATITRDWNDNQVSGAIDIDELAAGIQLTDPATGRTSFIALAVLEILANSDEVTISYTGCVDTYYPLPYDGVLEV